MGWTYTSSISFRYSPSEVSQFHFTHKHLPLDSKRYQNIYHVLPDICSNATPPTPSPTASKIAAGHGADQNGKKKKNNKILNPRAPGEEAVGAQRLTKQEIRHGSRKSVSNDNWERHYACLHRVCFLVKRQTSNLNVSTGRTSWRLKGWEGTIMWKPGGQKSIRRKDSSQSPHIWKKVVMLQYLSDSPVGSEHSRCGERKMRWSSQQLNERGPHWSWNMV